MKTVKLVYTLIYTHTHSVRGERGGRKYLFFIMIKSYLNIIAFMIFWNRMERNAIQCIHIYTCMHTLWYENVFVYICTFAKTSNDFIKVVVSILV